MAEILQSYYCEKCNRTMDEKQFYGSNNQEKYPQGKLKQCKKCISLHVDNFDPKTYLWILQECDVPYIPDEWHKLLMKWGKDKSKLTGMTILGRYLSKMKLKQYCDFRWKDNEFLQELNNSKIEQAMKSQGYDGAEIAAAVNKASFAMPDVELTEPEYQTPVSDNPQELFPQNNDFEDSLISDLTDEDRTYLCLKWGKTYRPDEWVRLEQLYEDMMSSYDIQSAGDKNTLILACKTSLKANQLLDLGDIDGAQKATKMYDSLMKSGKWTAQQNKSEKGEYVDSISELVAICEKDGFIPRYYVDGPQDKVDRVIQDMQEYTHTLITEEMHLGGLIERAVKQIEEDREREQILDDSDTEEAEASLEKDLFDQPEKFLTDQDFMDFKDFEEDEAADTEALLCSLIEEEE